jgi:hypothetical protein
VWVARRDHVTPHGADTRLHPLSLRQDDGAGPRRQARGIDPGPRGTVESRVLMFVRVVERGNRGAGRRCQVPIRMMVALVFPMMCLSVRQRCAGYGERDE